MGMKERRNRRLGRRVVRVPTPIVGEYLTLEEAAALLKTSRGTLWSLRKKDPSFPTPIALGPQLLRLSRRELDLWLETRRSRFGFFSSPTEVA
jgi:predicted DNA-binding transcriptional regulator AlpA